MRTVLGIPSGQRTNKLLKCIESWRKVCDFEIAVRTWDRTTQGALGNKIDYNYYVSEIESFAINHNYIAKNITDWDVYICGADDLYPKNAISKIENVCQLNPGKVIWVMDGLFNALPTHPIITRGWYDKYGYIFDESYRHNFTDTDLFVRLLKASEVVKCFQISFDHRHPLGTGEASDEIYEIGSQSFQDDRKIFYEKHPEADNTLLKNVIDVTV